MRSIAIILTTVLFAVTSPTMKSFGQVANCNISLEKTDGFCYGSYLYNNKKYEVCYGRPSMPKTIFHFANGERKYLLILSKRYSSVGMNNRTLILDINNNIVQEIDSCSDKNSGLNCKKYIATSGDTVYVAHHDNSIRAYLFSEQMKPTFLNYKKSDMLKKIMPLQDVDTWCVSKSNRKLAYKRDKEDYITIILDTGTINIPSGFAEVIAWRDENCLLYTKIKVKGHGDFFYDLFEYNISSNRSRLILEDLLDVYDYYDNKILYSASNKKLTVAKLNDNDLETKAQYDLSTLMECIYSAYIINDEEFIISGDKDQTDCHYFKCTISKSKN